MKKTMLFVGALVLAIVVTACGGNGGGDNAGEGSSSGGGGEETSNVDASAAKDVFKSNCASCHGENLKGKSGPSLEKVGSSMSKDDILKQIKNGGGGMPGGLIKGDKADNVAGWLANKK